MKNITLKHILFWATMICTILAMTLITSYAADEPSSVERIDAGLDIVANNVSYSDSIYILYAISNKGFDRTEHEIKMLFWDEPQEIYALGTEKYSKTDEGTKKVKGEDCLIFYSDGIAAKEMTDDIYARACTVIDGNEYYSDVMKFSVLEYVYTMKEQGNVGYGQIKLFTSMLQYGTEAQNSFGHNTSRPANGAYHKISVVGGTTPDGFDNGRYLEGEKVVITPNAPEMGMRFAYWKDEKGIIVSYDKSFEIVVGNSYKEYTAVYRDISSISAQLKLTTEIPYDGDIEALDLPSAVTFDANGESVILDIYWDTSSFVANTVGKQTLYATLDDPEAYLKYGIEPGSIVMEATTLPYTFKIDQTTGEYILTGYHGTESNVTIPTNYRNVFITTIASKAFNSVESLVSVSIPRTVKRIESGAFWYCDNIKDIVLPFIGESENSSNSWFGWIFGANDYEIQYGVLPLALESVTLMDGATKIPNYAFYKCTQIQEFHTPDTIRSIGNSAFRDCSSITEFTVPNELESIQSPFYGCYNLKKVYVNNIDNLFNLRTGSQTSGLGDSLFAMGAELWCDGKPVTDLIVPEGTTEIKMGLFKGCTTIKSIFIPASVSKIGFTAFSDMNSLESITFEEGSQITSLSHTFSDCPKLTQINLESLTKLISISSLFSGCTSLESIKLPESLTNIGYYSFTQTAIREICLPDGIQAIGTASFCACRNLRHIVLPTGLIEIGDGAFQNCNSLASIELPSSLATIGDNAFRSTALTEITLPERLCKIEYDAFAGSYLSKVIVHSNSLTEVSSSAFNQCNSLFEIYDLVGLSLTLGGDEYGGLARNAKVIHTSLEEDSRIQVDDEGFIFYTDDTETLLIGYVGRESDITLPTLDTEYKIYPYALSKHWLYDGRCTSLTSVTIPDCVTEIGEYAFCYQRNLYSIRLGAGISVISGNAFQECYRLKLVINDSEHLTLSKGSYEHGYVDYYAEFVFNPGDAPDEITIEERDGFVVLISGERIVLIDCLLTEQTITVPSYVTEIGSYAFAYSNIHTVVLPDSISKIGNHAFYECNNLESIVLGNGLKALGDHAFYSCNNLESILLPDTLERIGEYAFASSAISMVVIPLATSEIGYGAFRSCENLKTIYCEAAEQPSGWSSAWLNGTNAEVVWGYDGTDESGV